MPTWRRRTCGVYLYRCSQGVHKVITFWRPALDPPAGDDLDADLFQNRLDPDRRRRRSAVQETLSNSVIVRPHAGWPKNEVSRLCARLPLSNRKSNWWPVDWPLPRFSKRFRLILIKPSHYDDDGYVIRWWRSMIPSNSLAALYGIGLDCAERQILGSDVAIDIEALDETNTRIDVSALLARFRRHGAFGLVALIGVQSNQYPRALDIARPFRNAGIPVAIDGFQVSGCLSMLDGHAIDLDDCRKMGIAMFAGEVEGRLDMVLRDAAQGRLAPLYSFMKQLPEIQGMPVPFLPRRGVAGTLGLSASFDTGRGCPYQCSFCTIINVQGRKSRYRSAHDVERLIAITQTRKRPTPNPSTNRGHNRWQGLGIC
jgi:hypothetical protein